MVRMVNTGYSRHNGVSISRSLSIVRGTYSAEKTPDETYKTHKKRSDAAKKRKGKGRTIKLVNTPKEL